MEKVDNVDKIMRARPAKTDCPAELKKRLQEKIGAVFGISSENIVITKKAG